MQCPRDNTSLEFVSNSRGTHFTCPKCAGIFYTIKYVDAFKYNYQSDILDHLFDLPDNPNKPRLNCPQCHSQMCVKKLITFDVDVCSDCRGIWFDKHELEKIIDACGQCPSSGESDLQTFLASWQI